jgi:peptidoglycan hydrolase-like protein with peptidoglycan-binding domain
MKPFTFLLALGCLLSSALASDPIRDAQTALKKEGFYYGEVTGSEDAETGAAIRRFQIRNGISVTGKLNGETLAAMGLGQKNARPAANAPAPAPVAGPSPAAQLNPPAPAQIAPANVARQPMPGLEAAPDPAPASESSAAARHSVRDGFAVVDPPSPIPAPVSTPTSMMFRGTPFADAPREVQQGMIRRAQVVMAARRNYRGPLDGVAGPATSEAVFMFQTETGLRRSGRLDVETLTEMNLLPPRPPGGPPLKPFYNPNRRRDSSVTVDFWVR